jgi:hypothetical protein
VSGLARDASGASPLFGILSIGNPKRSDFVPSNEMIFRKGVWYARNSELVEAGGRPV